MFIKTDGVPYASLEQGISEALGKLVREAVVVSPKEEPVRIAAEIRPDLVLVLDALGVSFPTASADALRELGIRTAVWLPDDPYHSDVSVGVAPHYDYVFTLEQSCIPLYKDLGCQEVHYLSFGASPELIRPTVVDSQYRSDICFIGSAFANRVALFDRMAPYLAGKDMKIIGYWWERLANYALLSKHIQGIWLSPEETMKYYSGAKIVINLHRGVYEEAHNSNSRNLPAFSVNPRMFEICACGTLQLTDARDELPLFYKPGVDIETFASPEDLMWKIEYFLTHENERRHIALNGLYRTVHDHTYMNRVTQLLQIVFGS